MDRVRQVAAPILGTSTVGLLNVFGKHAQELLGPLNDEQAAPPLFLLLLRGLYVAGGRAEWLMRMPAFIAGLLALSLAALFSTRSALRLLRGTTDAMMRLSEAVAGAEIPYITRKDPSGTIARAMQVFQQNGLDRARLEAEQRAERELPAKRTETIEEMTAAFEQQVTAVQVGGEQHG